MKNIKLLPIYLCILIAIGALSCKSQQKTLKIDIVNESKNNKIDFPYDIIGFWKGELEIFKADAQVQKIPMSMLIEEANELDTYVWQLIYNEGENEDKRTYALLTYDQVKGHYLIDEDNGIVLDAFLFENKLVSTFSVQESLLTVIYTFLPEDIIFEVFAGPQKAINRTGDIKVGEATIPPVDSYKTAAFQRGTLKRIRG